MDTRTIKIIVAAFGILFAIWGAVSAVLQAKWTREQRKSLRGILKVLHGIRADGIKNRK